MESEEKRRGKFAANLFFYREYATSDWNRLESVGIGRDSCTMRHSKRHVVGALWCDFSVGDKAAERKERIERKIERRNIKARIQRGVLLLLAPRGLRFHL